MSLGGKYEAGAHTAASVVLEVAFGKAENEAAFPYTAFPQD